MKISGLTKMSTLDYPEHLSSVIFTAGCNFNCSFCHNRHILNKSHDLINESIVLDYLEKRKNLLDGLVITGGEPTIQKDLVEFCQKIKNMGYEVKLDTNGSNPYVLSILLEHKIIDYVAIDYKAPWYKYEDVCGVSLNIDNIKQSIYLLTKYGIDWELRTTMIPDLDIFDYEYMFLNIPGKPKVYRFNKYREVKQNVKITKAVSFDEIKPIENLVNQNITIEKMW